ncbi:galactosylceramide sulfotransferase-like [Saccoglossus kowalevskii]|uniref:Galactosylceramide sulfotransferase-like n=1 Tax=Saccoglossus kowalevskii TaxID=10224 RepID=A0ABM0LXK9_SACKO|nr:PREDICTED: galactosylceramide sulfotransferase-like [Saccoglossus kowalevskii]
MSSSDYGSVELNTRRKSFGVSLQTHEWQNERTKDSYPRDLSTNIEILNSSEDFGSKGSYKLCEPVKNFVFVKTTKTASTTVGATLYRYGLKHNLVAALPVPPTGVDLHIEGNKVDVTTYPCTEVFPGYNYISSHLRMYNRESLETVIPNATYITILRSPYTQFRSSFYFYAADRTLNLEKWRNPFEKFVKNLTKYRKPLPLSHQSRNGQLFRLGYDCDLVCDIPIDQIIQKLDKEIDLVMITEYLDESFVLLKQLMCWSTKDIVYYSLAQRPRGHTPITKGMEAIISKWNRLDLILYNYFNRTLWRKIEKYDGDFKEDLRLFRAKQIQIANECAFNSTNDACKLSQLNVGQLKKLVAKLQYNKFCSKQKQIYI